MRDNIVAIVGTEGFASVSEAELDDQPAVALKVMRIARQNFLAPSEDEALAGAISALWRLYPDDENLRQETRAIGDRNKLLSAAVSGVPVDWERADVTPEPDNALGLMKLWRESAS